MSPKINKKLLGATKARLHSPLLKGINHGQAISDLSDSIGIPLLPWQRWVLDDMTTVDKAGAFIRKTNLVLCARQNGKTHLARMRILAGLFLFNEKNIVILSSNRSMALATFREVAYAIESHDHLSKQVQAIRFANGTESIVMNNGARLDVVAATRDGSRGRTANFLYMDEIREIGEEAFSAATPVTRARPNAQTLLTSNAGDAFSTVLNGMRERALSSPPKSFGFYEWSAPQFAKIMDKKGWAAANPALGYTISEENIEESISTSSIETTRTETLCQWIDSLQSPWPHGAVEACSDKSLSMSPGPLTVFAFDISPSRRDASLVMGQIMPDGRIGVAVLETFHSQISIDELKIAAAIKKWCDLYYPRVVCFDKYTTASVAARLERSGVRVQDVSGASFYTACSDFHEALSNSRIVHSGQELLIQHMLNCAAKSNDSSWRIVRRKSAGPVDIAIGLAMVIHVLAQPISEAKVYS
ncbi:MAG: terminase large subunit [Betaproteobacteria bacterium]